MTSDPADTVIEQSVAFPSGDLAERLAFFHRSYTIQGNGCWIWQGRKTPNGYAVIYVAGRNLVAHRWAYQVLVAPVPDLLQMDHLCRTPACVNPSHLEPVTQRENILRGDSPTARNARKTHCDNGHPLTLGDTYEDPGRPGSRICRICHAENVARYRANHHQEVLEYDRARGKQKTPCPTCGKQIRKGNLPRHERTHRG